MIRINLLPTKAERKKESVIQQLVVASVAIVLVLAGCWVVNRNVEGDIQREKDTIRNLEDEIRALQAVIAQVEDFKKKKRQLNQKIDTIKSLNAKRSGPVKLMDEFTHVVPRKAWIVTYRETEKQLTLEGLAVDGPTVADFVDNLRASKFFFDVQLTQVQQVYDASAGKIQRFNINCRVNYTPAGGSG